MGRIVVIAKECMQGSNKQNPRLRALDELYGGRLDVCPIYIIRSTLKTPISILYLLVDPLLIFVGCTAVIQDDFEPAR